ncbi:CNDH2 protein, partial [Spelaeornis formosus]|nr:CNDH2 protein [Elachura formosa]
RREKLPTSLGPDGRDADATFTDKEEEEFLSLDDIPETSQASVDMRSDQQLSAVNIVPLTPMSLVPPEEGEKKDNPLLSRRGEVLASRRDFRMNTSTPHACGAFLLELAGPSPSHPQPEQRPGTATGTGGLQAGWHWHFLAEAPGGFLSRQGGNGGTWKLLQPLPIPTSPGAAGPEDDDNDILEAPGDDMEVTPVPEEHVEAQRSTPQTRGYMLQARPPSQNPKAHRKEMLNPWQSLDPFGDSEKKPFRKGRRFLLPPGLDDTVGGKRKRRGPRKLQDFVRCFSAACEGCPRSLFPTPADLEVLYWRHFKERMAAHRKLQSLGGAPGDTEGVLRVSQGALGGSQGALRGVPMPADDDLVESEDLEPDEPEELGQKGSSGELLTLPPQIPTPSELFMASSQKFAQETELSQRIRLWEEHPGTDRWHSLSPPCPQESRAPFDVRAYGVALTQACAQPAHWHSLASLVAGQPPFEVCRYLLASLQLANDGEVELAQDAGLEAALDTARLRLLSARPAHERFQHFQLPSQSQ